MALAMGSTQNEAHTGRKVGGRPMKITNPGKRFFLQLPTAALRDVHAQHDEEELSYARKVDDSHWIGLKFERRVGGTDAFRFVS